MLPSLTPGQIVVGWFMSELRPGDVVIVSHDGIEKVKRIEKQQSNLLYLLGDNPNGSTDSRDFGWVQADRIVAKVIWPKI